MKDLQASRNRSVHLVIHPSSEEVREGPGLVIHFAKLESQQGQLGVSSGHDWRPGYLTDHFSFILSVQEEIRQQILQRTAISSQGKRKNALISS